jgi:hypothetical protein
LLDRVSGQRVRLDRRGVSRRGSRLSGLQV